ncbi:SDR family oxidoreductase [Nocardia sp. NPDC052566]|uniref:SDR family oxidoreductase n=1 Tax=Nocardia sp. NPDC052566 TaxID=3364330 RepID=UPI0037C74647
MKLETGQVAVVTGAANGIGKAVATALAGRGLHVVLADVEAESVAAAAAELGGGTLAVATDVADIAQVRALAERTMREFGRVDIAFNNAGTGVGGPSWTIAPQDWQRTWSVNVGGVVNGINAFVPHMVTAGRGHIVNTSSLAGLTATPFSAPYSASKHAVVAISEALHTELALLAPGVGVTVVCPGPVDTRLLRGLEQSAKSFGTEDIWPGEVNPEQLEQFAHMRDRVFEMLDETIPATNAADIILTAVEADQLYVTTHPKMALSARDRIDTILAQFGTPDCA